MLQNAYLLAKIGADTAENDPMVAKKNWSFVILPNLAFSSLLRCRSPARPPGCGPRRSPGSGWPAPPTLAANAADISNRLFAKFWRARSRLYRSRFLRENMHFAAFVKLYTIWAFFEPLRTQTLCKESVIVFKNQRFWWNRQIAAKTTNIAKSAKI